MQRFFLFCFATLAAGCVAEPPLTSDMNWPAPTPNAEATVSTLATSVEGRPIEVVTLGDGPEVVLVVGGIHGNEAAGIPLVRRLVEEAQRQPTLLVGRTLIAVPELNPDGVAANERFNANGVDLNRNWPAANRHDDSARSGPTPLSEPESAALAKLIDRARPSRILTIHQPLACVDWDGPASALARAMADASDLPAKRLGGRPGSMGSHLGGERGLPIVTLELPRQADALGDEVKWHRYGESLLAFLSGVRSAHPHPHPHSVAAPN